MASVLDSLGSATSDTSTMAERRLQEQDIQRLQQLPVEEIVAEVFEGVDAQSRVLLTEVRSTLGKPPAA